MRSDQLFVLLDESKKNKREVVNNRRGSSRCIKVTDIQKKRISKLIERIAPDQCFLLWNSSVIYTLISMIDFNSLLPLVSLWQLDGFFVQLVIPLFSLRQVEFAF